MNNLSWGYSLLLGVVLGGGALFMFADVVSPDKPLDEFALGEENTVSIGVVSGKRVHCHGLTDLEECLIGYQSVGQRFPVTLWLGNSQLHAINQFQPGQETAVPELHRLVSKHGKYLISLSQPNANLQEHYLLFAHLLDKLPIDTLILPVVFDDMREDGIRAGLINALSDPFTVGIVSNNHIGKSWLDNFSDQGTIKKDMAALRETVQEKSERYLDTRMEEYLSIWKKRSEMRGSIFISLYKLRNWLFRINPSTARRMIPGRYLLNFMAYKEMLALASERGINVLTYVVPIRNDVEIPYDLSEYTGFKKDFRRLSLESDAVFLDLENLVPARYWGTKPATSLGRNDELDFMHFQDAGHRLLAAALFKELASIWLRVVE